MLTLTAPHNLRLSFQTVPGFYGSGSARSGFFPLPSAASGAAGLTLERIPAVPGCAHAEDSRAPASSGPRACRNIPCQRTDGLLSVPSSGAPPASGLPPAVGRRAGWLRLRLSTTGFHARLPAGFSWYLFFPRSVGLAPTSSCASGALTTAPSMLCHAQAIFSRSLYSANPLRQRRTKKPASFHSRKYLWTELALPKRSSGNAFHWQPVRNTYIIPSNTRRISSALRPPPGLRRYFFPFSRLRSGINVETFSHNSSETVQLFICPMV